jgi:hypothetical protein
MLKQPLNELDDVVISQLQDLQSICSSLKIVPISNLLTCAYRYIYLIYNWIKAVCTRHHSSLQLDEIFTKNINHVIMFSCFCLFEF